MEIRGKNHTRKTEGNTHVAKIRYVLLLEAEFNRMNKIICNSRVLLRLEECKVIPYELIECRRGKYSQRDSLNKNLV